MRFKPETLVYRLILKPDIQKQSKGGIDLSALSDRTQAINTDKGEVLFIGPKAFKDYGHETPPVSIGDLVYYAKYGAKVLKDEDSGELFIIVNDEDILVSYEVNPKSGE